MPSDEFDFQKFLDQAMSPDHDLARDTLNDAVSDGMEQTMARVAPRVLSILRQEMGSDPGNQVHLNCVMNAALWSVFAWLAAITPKGQTNGRDNDALIAAKVTSNMREALQHRDERLQAAVRELAVFGERLNVEAVNRAALAQLDANTKVLQALLNRGA